MRKKLHVSSLRGFWWVLILLIGNYCCFAFLQSAKNEEIVSLQMKKSDLLAQKEDLQNRQQDLLLHIQSQSDSSWIELVLMKELGVVPEKHIKVYFTKEK